jgi:hypothetical protein
MPLVNSPSKKAFKKNVEVEMESGKPQKQSLAIAFSVQRKNKRKMAHGGPVKAGRPGGESENTNEPKIHPGANGQYEAPPAKEFMAKKFPTGSATPQNSGSHAPGKVQYMGKEAADPLFMAEGGVACAHCQGTGMYGGMSENTNEPHLEPGATGHYSAVKKEMYDGDKEQGGFNPHESYKHPSEEEYMDDRMPAYAHGGSIAERIRSEQKFKSLDEEGNIDDPFDNGEGISQFQEEGPAVRQKYNSYARNYNQGDDRQISKQPMESKGDEREEESENKQDRVGAIRKKLKKG